jgi:FAD:protein FMN transferase
MKQTQISMGMPISVEIADENVKKKDIDEIFSFFSYVDSKFSMYKKNSEISMINAGKIEKDSYSPDMKEVFKLCDETKIMTNGFFDIYHNGKNDPTGLTKGWAIHKASKKMKDKGYKNFIIDAGGDIEVSGLNKDGKNWIIGLRNPFDRNNNIKIVGLTNKGIATSGTSIRGNHIYNPFIENEFQSNVISITIIAPNILEADRFATAAFAMGKEGIKFISLQPNLDAFMIDLKMNATYTSGFEKYVIN